MKAEQKILCFQLRKQGKGAAISVMKAEQKIPYFQLRKQGKIEGTKMRFNPPQRRKKKKT